VIRCRRRLHQGLDRGGPLAGIDRAEIFERGPQLEARTADELGQLVAPRGRV
jgi:hypothetical protein